MRRALPILLGVILALAAISQFVLPGLAENQIEKRLTEGGGKADANLSAFPAVRLLFEDGGRLEVEGSGLDLDIDENPEVFEKLEGFEDVDLSITESVVGPLDVSSFTVRRFGDAPYSVVGEMTTNGAELADALAEGVGVPGGGVAEFLLGQTDFGSGEIPISIDMEMELDDGRITVTEGGGEIAGLPTGPLAEVFTAWIVVRI